MAKKSSEAWDIEFQGIVSTLINDAKSFVEGDIRTRRTMATDYWKGRLPDVDGEEVEADSSTVVMTEVRDTVLAMMPNLMRMFFGGQSVETYRPLRPDAEEKAQQATDYANEVVLKQDNPGFSIFWDWFLDALVRCNGFVKTWYEVRKVPTYAELTGLDEIALAAEVEDPNVAVLGKRSYAAKDAAGGEILDGMTGGPVTLYDVKIRRYVERKRIRVDAIPCEEVIVNSGANSYDMERFRGFIGHRTLKTVSELVEMGYDEADVKDASTDTDVADNEETRARRSDDSSADLVTERTPGDPSQKLVVFTEGVGWLDYDQDGIAEMRQLCCVGTDNKIVKNEPIDYQPISTLCPYPEPFTFFGMSVADHTMDIQRINSRVARDMLNSLAQAVEPMMGAVDGQVNLDDLLNPDISKVVRMRAPGMVNPIITPFVGREALPVIEYMKQVREARTGISDASQGLDPKVLQSTDNDAVMATLTNGQARLELVARIFAETGVKHLFKNILHLMTKYPDKERTVKLRGKWVQVDTSAFDANMDVEVDMPLGRGTVRDQMSFLMTVNGDQGQLLNQLGPINPVVTIDQFVNTKRRITELGGFKNVDAFWLNPDAMEPQDKEQRTQAAVQNAAAQSAPQGGPAAPDPEIEKMKVEAMLQKEAMIDRREREFKMAELQADLQKNSADNQAKIMIAQMQQQGAMQTASIDAMVTKFKTEQDNQTKIIVESIKPRGGADNGARAN